MQEWIVPVEGTRCPVTALYYKLIDESEENVEDLEEPRSRHNKLRLQDVR